MAEKGDDVGIESVSSTGNQLLTSKNTTKEYTPSRGDLSPRLRQPPALIGNDHDPSEIGEGKQNPSFRRLEFETSPVSTNQSLLTYRNQEEDQRDPCPADRSDSHSYIDHSCEQPAPLDVPGLNDNESEGELDDLKPAQFSDLSIATPSKSIY